MKWNEPIFFDFSYGQGCSSLNRQLEWHAKGNGSKKIGWIEESFRRIEMMQRHERKHTFFFAFRKDFMVEVHTLLICSSGPTKNKIFR